MNKRLQTEEIKKKIAKLPQFKSKCYVCGCKISKRGMTFHHLWYIFNDVIYKNYPKNSEGQLQYYKELEPLIREMPKRFLYVCNTDHIAIERMNRYGDAKFKRLVKARKLTKTRKNK
jgi:hypothetical protein